MSYGGATTLAAAGYPEYIIALYGSWAEGSKAMNGTSARATSSLVQEVVNQLMKQRAPVVDHRATTNMQEKIV